MTGERSQKEIVLNLLIHRGETGVSAREAIYDLHITRLAAIVFDLKQEGYRIRTEQKSGQTARYILLDPRPKRQMPMCVCGDRYVSHVSGMRCMRFECPCEKYTESMV